MLRGMNVVLLYLCVLYLFLNILHRVILLRRILMDYDWYDDDIAYETGPYVRDRDRDAQVLKSESTSPPARILNAVP